VTSTVGALASNPPTHSAYSPIATMSPAVGFIGKKTSKLAGITSAVLIKSQGAGQSRSRKGFTLTFHQTFTVH
jgi:hypothetical protein